MTDLLPEAEERRILALEALHVLDTAREDRFDRITDLARTIFDVPLSTITLIDRDRAWFKSCVGLDLTELPRGATFCDRTVHDETVIIVEDARLDERFRDLPSVSGPPHLRFYAGFPIRDRHGVTIGTFCLYDTRPRTLSDHDTRVATELASWVEAELLRSEDADRARRVQRALLPRSAPRIPGYRAAAICRPATIVAGDFFDHQDHGDRHAFVVADVMGKGTGAAILMASVRAVLRSELRALADDRLGEDGLARAVTETNATVLEDLGSSRSFVTALVGWADPASGEIRLVDAGHGLSLLQRRDGRVEHLSYADLPLGVAESTWSERTVRLEPGDSLIVFSDGLLDLLGGTMEAVDQVADLARGAGGPQELVDRVDELIQAGPLVDDVTVLVIQRDEVR